jgi:4,5-dihydroxyphthalate decarboxylase
MNSVTLKIAIATYGHTAALKDGRVGIQGVHADCVEINPIIAAFRRMVRDVEFDVCEMAPATYMIARAGGSPFKALPIFIFRRFHHSGFVVRGDAGIRTPKDLEGKKAGVRAYSVSTGIWTRGIFADEFGLDNSKVTWVVDDEEHVTTLKLPANVIKAPAGQSLVSMMADGQLQAAFTGPAGIGRAGAPKDGWEASAAGKAADIYPEIIVDAAKAEAEWFKRTGIYPTHGLIVVKDSLLAAHPWLARSLFDAFSEAKALYIKQLQAGEVKTDADKSYVQLSSLVGDPLPYGVKANRHAIDALIRYTYEQGLLPNHYTAADMFVDPQ